MEHLYGEERVREWGLLSLEKRQLLRHPAAAPRTPGRPARSQVLHSAMWQENEVVT